MRAIVSPRQGFASGLLVVFTVVAPALAPLDHALGASRAPGPSTRASAGWLVFSRFDPKIDDDAWRAIENILLQHAKPARQKARVATG